MNRPKEVFRAKRRERQQIKQAGRGREVASTILKRPTVMLDDKGETYSVIVERESPSLTRFWCHECHQDVEGTAYQLAGDLACERCVTNYCRLRNQNLSDVVPKKELEKCLAEDLAAELPWRARGGDRLLREREKRKRRHAF